MESKNIMKGDYIEIEEIISIAQNICNHIRKKGFEIPLLLMVEELKIARNQKFIKQRRKKYVWINRVGKELRKEISQGNKSIRRYLPKDSRNSLYRGS